MQEADELDFKVYSHPPCNCVLFLIPGVDPDRDRRKIASSHQQTSEGYMDMGTTIANPWAGGVGLTHLGSVILFSGTANAHFGVRNMGGDLLMAKTLGGSTTIWRDGSQENSPIKNLTGAGITCHCWRF